MNSFRALGGALEFEIVRQIGLREHGDSVLQETRGWDDVSGRTLAQRSKEYAHDYRYFPEPDLPPLRVTTERVVALREQLPRMPGEVAKELVDGGAPADDVAELIQDRDLAEYAQVVISSGVSVSDAVTWIVHEMIGVFCLGIYL